MPAVKTCARRRPPARVNPLTRVSKRARAAHGRQGARTTNFDTLQSNGKRSLVENRNRSEGPSTYRNPHSSQNNGANDYQDPKHLEQVQPEIDDANDYQTPEDQGNRNQGRFSQHVMRECDQPIDLDQLDEELGRRLLIEPSPDEDIEFPVEESMEQGDNEAGDTMEWLEANAAEAAPDESQGLRIVYDPCTSPSCPVGTIRHESGLYLHDGKINEEVQDYPFGLSNPPPAVWQMVHRLEAGTEQPGDQECVDSFTRNHALVLSTQFPPPLDPTTAGTFEEFVEDLL